MSATRALLTPLRWFCDWWNPTYRAMVVPHVAALFDDDGSSVLDFGCDDGSTALAIRRFKPSLTFQGVDVQGHRPCAIPRTIYDGRRLPFADSSFDAVLAFDVLHHTDDILASLKELVRVARRYVILKDHACQGPISRWMVGFADVLTNAPYGIRCACNYPSLSRWKEYFADAGLDLVSYRDDLPLGVLCNARQNPIFKLAKRAQPSAAA